MSRGLLARIGAVSIALTWVVAQSAALVESTSTIHARCLEHGEQVHTAGETPPAGRHYTNPEQQQHEHCELARALASAATEPMPSLVAAWPLAVVTPTGARSEHFYAVSWLWAPKTSPPSRV